MITPRLSIADHGILAAANLWLILRHPRNALRFWREGHGAPLFATPRGHNALMQWRKYLDHNPLFVTLTDKLAAKDWARARGVNSALVVWRGQRPEDIPAELIDARHVIKTNHGWGSNTFPGREPMSRDALNTRVNRQLRHRYGTYGQWAYDQIAPKVFVEEMLVASPLWEMTFRCCDGRIASFNLACEKKTERDANSYFSADDARLPRPRGVEDRPELPADFVLPHFIAEAKAIAMRLSQGIDHVRVDLSWDGDRILLGELTCYSAAGFGTEERVGIGALIEPLWLDSLPLSWLLSAPHRGPLSLYARAFRKWLALRRAALNPMQF